MDNNILYKAELQSLEELWLHVTYLCNLECTHCLFTCSPVSEAKELSYEAALHHVEQALAGGLEKLYITGGEPFLWSHIDAFLAWYYSAPRVPLTILTNGILITKSKANALATYADQGLQLRISLECYLEDNNDAVRGQGSFTRTISAIKTLNSYGMKPWIAFTDKSGSSSCCNKDLENSFINILHEQHSIAIAGLKIISAYEKGRFNTISKTLPCADKEGLHPVRNLTNLQCCYGLAVCAEGIAPCPILVDQQAALYQGDLQDLIGSDIDLNHSFCVNCMTSGTTCGQ